MTPGLPLGRRSGHQRSPTKNIYVHVPFSFLRVMDIEAFGHEFFRLGNSVLQMEGLFSLDWRQIWRVTGRESGSPELLGSSRTSPEVPRTSPEVLGDFPGSSLTVELNSNPEVPRKFPKLPGSSPNFPGSSGTSPKVKPLSLGSLTPSPDSQELSLTGGTFRNPR